MRKVIPITGLLFFFLSGCASTATIERNRQEKRCADAISCLDWAADNAASAARSAGRIIFYASPYANEIKSRKKREGAIEFVHNEQNRAMRVSYGNITTPIFPNGKVIELLAPKPTWARDGKYYLTVSVEVYEMEDFIKEMPDGSQKLGHSVDPNNPIANCIYNVPVTYGPRRITAPRLAVTLAEKTALLGLVGTGQYYYVLKDGTGSIYSNLNECIIPLRRM